MLLRILFITALFYLIPNILGYNHAQAYFYFAEEEEAAETEKVDEDKKQPSKSIQRSDIKIVNPVSSFEQQKQDLTHYLSGSKTQSIKVGDNEYIIIEETSSTQNNKGVAILIPDWQQGVANPKAINFLRKNLPDAGWSTISVQSPNKPMNYPSAASTKEERIEQNKTALMPYQNELKSLVTAVMEKANNYPGIFLVITEGSQAAMLIDLYTSNQSLLPAALITLSAGMYSEVENDSLAKNIAMSELPVLDLILKKDRNTVIENAMLRKKYVNKELKADYRQKSLHNMVPGYYPEQTLLTEINGWLKTIGW